MKLEQLESNKHLLLKCISGSQAYGLALPHSDTDIKGVFILPRQEYFGLTYTDQLNNATNDVMFYEIKKFIELLVKNNPNILELLATPAASTLYKHPLMDELKPTMFLSRLCRQTFGEYAIAQIKKARGLNKKILNPIDETRKSILRFCYVVQGYQSVHAEEWLSAQGYSQQDCGLVKIDHMRDMYALFHQSQIASRLSGIYSDEFSNDVSLSSVEAGALPKAILHFNKDGYSVYCREYKQYWDWVKMRNDERYENTLSHGKNYDAKNMMHVFRLLNMAEEIALNKSINVLRPEREWLLDVRAGKFEYDDLLKLADEKVQRLNELFDKADLPDAPDEQQAELLLIRIRERFYGS